MTTIERGWKGAEVEEDGNWLLVTPEGVYRDVDVSVTEDQYRQMHTGYTCAWCGEPWESPWPTECTLPGCWSPKPMTEEAQRRYLDERFGGEKWFGPSTSTIASWDNAIDKAVNKSKPSIVVPRTW